MTLTLEIAPEVEAQANAIWTDMTSGDAPRHNQALRALFAAPEIVQTIVKERSGEVASAYYSTPEGEAELADWRALDGEPFHEDEANGSNGKHQGTGVQGNGAGH